MVEETKKQDVKYVREQNGHSIIAAILLGWSTLYILPVYWAISKNHYYHL